MNITKTTDRLFPTTITVFDNVLEEEYIDSMTNDIIKSSKEVGRKETRPNPLGLPDLVKPEGWEAPSHEGNHGKLNDI